MGCQYRDRRPPSHTPQAVACEQLHVRSLLLAGSRWFRRLNVGPIRGGIVALTTSRSLALSVQNDDWRELSACRDTDPDLFFPVGTTGPAIEQIENAKAVCRECEVREP